MDHRIDPQLKSVLSGVLIPYLNEPMVEVALEQLRLEDNCVYLSLTLPFPCSGEHDEIRHSIEVQLKEAGYSKSEIVIKTAVAAHSGQNKLPAMAGVKNIIAISSGKGGVGKSTTAVNLALALAKEGASVGILDADIYGPSQGMLLGVPSGTRPESDSEKYFHPITALGLQSMSMSYLIDEETPMVWRGPMVSGALQQLLTQTRWDNLDYLFIDMPPGTGDIQLTLSQKVPVAGAVVVTTPQDIALLDARKGIEMFRKVDIPVLGIIENMSVHICSECGHAEHIFGEGGGLRIASRYDCEVLGQLPLSLNIRVQADAGKPTVFADPESTEAQIYRKTARQLAAALVVRSRKRETIPFLSVSDD